MVKLSDKVRKVCQDEAVGQNLRMILMLVLKLINFLLVYTQSRITLADRTLLKSNIHMKFESQKSHVFLQKMTIFDESSLD